MFPDTSAGVSTRGFVNIEMLHASYTQWVTARTAPVLDFGQASILLPLHAALAWLVERLFIGGAFRRH